MNTIKEMNVNRQIKTELIYYRCKQNNIVDIGFNERLNFTKSIMRSEMIVIFQM